MNKVKQVAWISVTTGALLVAGAIGLSEGEPEADKYTEVVAPHVNLPRPHETISDDIGANIDNQPTPSDEAVTTPIEAQPVPTQAPPSSPLNIPAPRPVQQAPAGTPRIVEPVVKPVKPYLPPALDPILEKPLPEPPKVPQVLDLVPEVKLDIGL